MLPIVTVPEIAIAIWPIASASYTQTHIGVSNNEVTSAAPSEKFEKFQQD